MRAVDRRVNPHLIPRAMKKSLTRSTEIARPCKSQFDQESPIFTTLSASAKLAGRCVIRITVR